MNSLSEAFKTKINAAKFFYKEISKLYTLGQSKSLPDEFFYHLDGCIFELHAASQMLLQIINIKSGVNEEEFNVSWSPKFKNALKLKCEPMYEFWEKLDASPDFWILEATRQHISHRNSSIVNCVTEGEDGYIISVALAIRYRYKKNEETGKREPKLIPTGRSIELLDELKSIEEFLESKFEELQILN